MKRVMNTDTHCVTISFQQRQLSVANLHKRGIPAMEAAFRVFKNVLLRIIDFIVEFYI